MCSQFIGACKEPVMVIVTELLLGGTLRKYLLNMLPKCLDKRIAVRFALDIARAMECLHAHGIIHRDLKPGISVLIPPNLLCLLLLSVLVDNISILVILIDFDAD